MSVRNEYQQRLEARTQTLEQLRRDDDRAANLRVAVFVLGALCAWAVLGSWRLPLPLLLLPLSLFVAAVAYHQVVRRKRSSTERAIEYYQHCLDRLEGKWSEFGPTGEEFLNTKHPYASDLDIFGKGSLFQLLGSPVTPGGLSTLAGWLAPSAEDPLPSCNTVVRRQNAVRSLRDQLDLRERLAVIGPAEPSVGNTIELHHWLATPSGLTAPWIRVVAALLGLLGIASLVAWFITGAIGIFFIVVLIQIGFIRQLRQPLNSIKQHSAKAVLELRRIVQVVAALETVAGEDKEIARLRSELIQAGSKASATIHRLERWVSQYENTRLNLFVAPLAFLSMFSVQIACQIDLWRKRHGENVEGWFRAAGKLETLLAFSQMHYENSDYCFPELVDSEPKFIASGLAHPLLQPGTAVANDVELTDDCRMLLVSGSNMSGKSTLLRSVGINTALAMAGAPVYARELKLARLRVAAAMRVQDSLQTGTSHFLAELQRIRLVVELAQKKETDGMPVLFLLDEILHGTNSHDRLVGARGVIHTLLETGAIGMVTTHDLALSDMVTELQQPARNVHFCDQWQDEKMTFDYRIREGVVPKGNALSLMRLLGLEV
ncbi:MAG: hypothetical protein MI725_01630 [Pirellulales bacterium]|nr:hypothetical protein [Pirellulales bacterium]